MKKNIFSLHRRAYAIKLFAVVMEQPALKNVNNYLNTNIYSYLETSGGQSSNLYSDIFIFSTPGLIRHQWQLKTVVFLHWCLIRTVPFNLLYQKSELFAEESPTVTG